ncbi:MAG: hypothetical protein JSU68_12500 [Phycisphaerales bacterium]|nr:MAG: hypothetical protein JSU68_12500 [Phycisphaerales bacterium]
MPDFEPAYRRLPQDELKARAEQAHERLADCDICAWNCHVNRLDDSERGNCRTGERAIISGGHPHFGEEAPLVGHRGSGTIFFSWCNLRCQFCQNFDISQKGEGIEVDAEVLANIMLRLEMIGCHNINLVSPSHVVPQWLEALVLAAGAGLNLPIVYNTGGYDSPATLRLLDGIVDIYMPDMKYMDAAAAEKYSLVPDYPEVNQKAIKEMHRQVGDLVIDNRGVAQRGLLVRHLVLPENQAGTDRVVRFLAREISENTYVNIMDQYRPCYKADGLPPLDRRITRAEYDEAIRLAREAGLHRLDGF